MHSYPLMTVSVAALLAAAPVAIAQQQDASVRVGEQVRGSLNNSSKDYSFELREGQGFEAILRSDDFDALLLLLPPGERTEAVARDDDGLGEGLNSRLRYVARTSGTHTLRVDAIGDTTGAYTLGVANWSPPRVRSSNIRVGQEVSGAINARANLNEQDQRFQQYRLNLTKGQRVELTTFSAVIDTVLSIGKDTPLFEALTENDDYDGDIQKSRVIFMAPETGAYAIRVTALAQNEDGRFTLKVAEAAPLGVAQPIEAGADIAATLSDKAPAGMGGVEADRYRLSADVNQSYEINLSSDDFDTYLAVYDENGDELVSDDDGGGSLNSSLVFTPRQAGQYYIEARGFGSSSGDYRLTVDAVAPPPAPVALPFDDEIEGELTDDDARANASARYDGYVFQGTEGQRIQITLNSAEFDAMLEIGLNSDNFSALASDDDGSGFGTDSRLVFQLPEDGEYQVRARSFSDSGRGAYEIRLMDRGPEPEAGSLLIGSTVRGSLSEYDNTLSGGMMGASYYDDYRFTANKDEKIRFTLVAPTFDAVVQVGSGVGDSFTQSKQDDDSLSDTHARLGWTVPRDGEYVVRVTSFGAGSTGDYSLIVERQP